MSSITALVMDVWIIPAKRCRTKRSGGKYVTPKAHSMLHVVSRSE